MKEVNESQYGTAKWDEKISNQFLHVDFETEKGQKDEMAQF